VQVVRKVDVPEAFTSGQGRRSFQKIFYEKLKVVKDLFYHSKLRKQPFLLKFSKSKVDQDPSLHPPPLPTPMPVAENDIICLVFVLFCLSWMLPNYSWPPTARQTWINTMRILMHLQGTCFGNENIAQVASRAQVFAHTHWKAGSQRRRWQSFFDGLQRLPRFTYVQVRYKCISKVLLIKTMRVVLIGDMFLSHCYYSFAHIFLQTVEVQFVLKSTHSFCCSPYNILVVCLKIPSSNVVFL